LLYGSTSINSRVYENGKKVKGDMMKKNCWLCGYSDADSKWTFETKTGKTKTVHVHRECLEQHITAKRKLK
jgi:hypothetical protein